MFGRVEKRVEERRERRDEAFRNPGGDEAEEDMSRIARDDFYGLRSGKDHRPVSG